MQSWHCNVCGLNGLFVIGCGRECVKIGVFKIVMPKRTLTTRKSSSFLFPMKECGSKEFHTARLSADPTKIDINSIAEFVDAFPGIDNSSRTSLVYLRKLTSGSAQYISKAGNASTETLTEANADARVTNFFTFCREDQEYSTLFLDDDEGNAIFSLQVNGFLLWDAAHTWWKRRIAAVEFASNLDNGWFRHAARLFVRFQEYKLLGTQSWWYCEDPAANEQQSRSVDVTHLEEHPSRASSPTPTLIVANCWSAPAVVQEAVQVADTALQSESAVPPKLIQQWVPEGGWLDHQAQLACYCGFNVELVDFCRLYEEKKGRNGVSCQLVRKWLLRHPQYLPDKFRSDDNWHIDHIISDSNGGIPWVLNYFIMPKSVNLHFKDLQTNEKKRYVGKTVYTAATSFAKWYRKAALIHIRCGRYDPKYDMLQGRA